MSPRELRLHLAGMILAHDAQQTRVGRTIGESDAICDSALYLADNLLRREYQLADKGKIYPLSDPSGITNAPWK